MAAGLHRNIYIVSYCFAKKIGCFLVVKKDDGVMLDEIFLEEAYRNKGIGSKLLENLIIASKEKNMSSITLEVNENNIYAISLYKKFNFETTGLRKKYYNGTDNAIIMTLKI